MTTSLRCNTTPARTLGDRRATRKCASLMSLAMSMMGGGSSVFAQDAGADAAIDDADEGNGLIVTLVKTGRDDVNDWQPPKDSIGLRACVEGSIEVTVGGLPSSSNFPYLEVWYSTGSGACNQADRATRVNSSQNCMQLTTDRDGQVISGYSALSTKVNIAPLCELNADQTRGAVQGPQTLYFLALRSQGSAEYAQSWRAFTIDVDTLAPAAPTNVRAGSGDNKNLVTWDSAAPGVRSFWVAADYDPKLPDDEASTSTPDWAAGTVGRAICARARSSTSTQGRPASSSRAQIQPRAGCRSTTQILMASGERLSPSPRKTRPATSA